jgi:hypothetical protein
MRYLLCLTGDARYGDSLEQVFYNTVLGAKPIREDGWSFYYSDYGHSGHKTDHRIVMDSPWPWDHDGRWPCCSGTLPQVAADYGISSYFRARDGVYVNLYVPSKLNWALDRSTSCTLTQQTEYPRENLIALRIDPSSPREFSLYLRIPAWAGPHTSVSINGKRLTAGMRPASFYKIGRTWKRGDLIELELDQQTSTRPVDAQTRDQVAVVRGPLVLFAIEDRQPTLDRAKLGQIQVRKDANNRWTLEMPRDNHPVLPFYEIGDEIYQTYWKVV